MRNNLFLAIALRFSGVFFSFILNIYLSHELEKEVLGTYFLLSQILLVLSAFLRRGVDLAFLKFGQMMSVNDVCFVGNKYNKETLFPVLILAIIIITIVYIFAPYDTFILIFFVAVSLIPYVVLNIIAEYIKGRGDQISSTVIQVCLMPVFIYLSYTLIKADIYVAYFVAVTVLMIVSCIKLYSVLKNIDNIEVGKRFNENNFWLDAKSFMFIGILNVVMSSMDLIMLGLLTEPKYVAEYGIANKLVALSSIVLVAVNGVLGPMFSSLWNEQKYKYIYQLFIKSTSAMLVCSLIMLIIFYLLGEQILVFLYGSSYSNSALLLKVLAIGQSIVLATGPVAYLLMMTNSKEAHKKSLYVAVITNLILNSILIPFYGAIGAAVATAVGLIIKNVYSFNYLLLKTEFRKMRYEE